ncbi:hypothetical protein, partial [Sphingomonas sp.]
QGVILNDAHDAINRMLPHNSAKCSRTSPPGPVRIFLLHVAPRLQDGSSDSQITVIRLQNFTDGF